MSKAFCNQYYNKVANRPKTNTNMEKIYNSFNKFCSMKQLGVFLVSWKNILIHHKVNTGNIF